MTRAAQLAVAIAALLGLATDAWSQDRGDAGVAQTIAISASSVSSAAAPPRFIEHFEPASFESRWSLSEHASTGEWSAVEWRRSQVQLGPRGAVITMAATPEGAARPYMSGEIVSREFYRYGYFETRLRMPGASGSVSAFFTYGKPGGEDTWNEIDMEFTGRDPRRLELVYHVAGDAALQVIQLPFDASAGVHTYGFDWQPDQIRWYVDNRLIHISRGGRVAELVHPQQMFASLWNSVRMPRWLGPVDPSQAPWRMHVRCMAYAPRYEGRSLCAS